MSYCNTYFTIGNPFCGDTDVTGITIPSGCSRILQPVLKTVLMNGGIFHHNPAFGGTDKAIFLPFITFPDDEARKKCCEKVDDLIEQTLLIEHQKISITLVECNGNKFDANLNLCCLFCQYQDIAKKINPIIKFIEENGGWFDEQTKQSPGFKALIKARANDALTAEQTAALFDFCKMRLFYFYFILFSNPYSPKYS